MKTRTVLLGDIADTCLGKMLDQNKNKGEYQPYLANVNVRWGGFDLEDLPQMKFLETEEERYGLRYGDILVCEGGEPGRCAIWKEQIPNMKFQKALHRVRVHQDEVDYRWLFYRFLYAKSQGEFDQYFSGTTTIKHMPGEKLVKIRLDLPELSAQNRIADVLSAYDTLIENNQKQIKLLEEAAQRLYKEWFVDLRFPGYESTPIVDGVPEGWEKRPIDDVFSFKYGKLLKTTLLSEKGLYPVYGANGIIGYYSEKNCDDYVTLITSRGNGSGDVLRTHHKETYVTNNSFIVQGKKSLYSLPFTHRLMNNIDFKAICTGSAQPQLTNSSISTLSITIPPNHIVTKFNEIVKTWYAKEDLLMQQNVTLEEVRDALLPRLMSGEMEV